MADPADWDAEFAADREHFRSFLADSGARGVAALRGFDAAMRDHDTGVMRARNIWHSISPAQRRTLLFLAPGRVLVCSARCAGYYDAVGASAGVDTIAKAARLDTARNLAARELVQWDGTAHDPERRAVITERAVFVLKHRMMEAPDGTRA